MILQTLQTASNRSNVELGLRDNSSVDKLLLATSPAVLKNGSLPRDRRLPKLFFFPGYSVPREKEHEIVQLTWPTKIQKRFQNLSTQNNFIEISN